MPLTLKKIDHEDLCHGWAWEIASEDDLADKVARILLGQYRHVAKILTDIHGTNPLSAGKAQAAAAIQQLTLGPGEDPWHRDGLVFQAISWIAVQLTASKAITRAPHIRPADKGFDGLQLEFGEDGKTITAVLIFEDKATQNARKTVREEVWSGIDELEKGERLNELTHEVSALLDARLSTDSSFDVDAAINNILWETARRYRVSITIDDTHNHDDARPRLFKGYDARAPGDVARRRAETIYLPELRTWMEQFSNRVIDKITQHANV